MAEEEKKEEKKKSSWWKWAVGAYVADRAVDSKIEEEVDRKVEEKLREIEERRELEEYEEKQLEEIGGREGFVKQEKAPDLALNQKLLAEKIAKDERIRKQLLRKSEALTKETRKLVKALQENHKTTKSKSVKFNKLIDVDIKYIENGDKLISFYAEKGVETAELEENLQLCIRNAYSMIFTTIMASLEATIDKGLKKPRISEKEKKAFNKMFKTWKQIIRKRELSSLDYERFVGDVKKYDCKGKIEGFLKILKQIEKTADLQRNRKKLDNAVKLVTRNREMRKKERESFKEVNIDNLRKIAKKELDADFDKLSPRLQKFVVELAEEKEKTRLNDKKITEKKNSRTPEGRYTDQELEDESQRLFQKKWDDLGNHMQRIVIEFLDEKKKDNKKSKRYHTDQELRDEARRLFNKEWEDLGIRMQEIVIEFLDKKRRLKT